VGDVVVGDAVVGDAVVGYVLIDYALSGGNERPGHASRPISHFDSAQQL